MAEPGVLRNLALSGARCDSPHDARRAVVAVSATTLLLVLVADLLTLWQHWASRDSWNSFATSTSAASFRVTFLPIRYDVLASLGRTRPVRPNAAPK